MQYVKGNTLESFTTDEYLALLIDHKWEHRKDRKITRLIKQANFRQPASLADVNYTQSRNLNKNMFARLDAINSIKRRENINGASGVGKSYLVQALGHRACLMEYRTIYVNTLVCLRD